MTVQYRVYDSLETLPLDTQQWDNIVEQSATSGIFLQKNWIESWWRHLRENSILYFVTAEEDSSVIAFAPLMIDTANRLRFIGDLNSDYLSFAVPVQRPELIGGLLRFLSSKRSFWDVMHLRNVPRESTFGAAFLDASRGTGLFAWRNYSVGAPYLQVRENAGAVESLLNKYSLRRAERQLAARGVLRYSVLRDVDEAAPHWKVFAAQHIERCKGADRASPFSNPRYVSFLRSVFESNSGAASVHFSTVLLSGKPVAYHYGFVSQGRLLWYKPSFDTGIRKCSPGLVLLRFLIQDALDNCLDEVDFTIGDEPFKERFCDNRRQVDSYRIHKSWIRARYESVYWNTRRHAKKMLR